MLFTQFTGMMFAAGVVAVAVAVLSPSAFAVHVVWVTNPVRPNETALLKTPFGASFFSAAASAVSLCDQANDQACRQVPLAQVWEGSAKFTVPPDLPVGVWSVLLRSAGAGGAEVARLNEADPWYHMCHDADDTPASSSGAPPAPTACKVAPSSSSATSSTLRIFGRGLGYRQLSQRHGFQCANLTMAAPNLTTARLTPIGSGQAGPAVVLTATTSFCYSASFALPSSLVAGKYAVEVKHSMPGSTYQKLGSTDESEGAVTVTKAPQVRASTAGVVPCCDMTALNSALTASVGVATLSTRVVVTLGRGVWQFGPLDSLIVPDGVRASLHA